MWDTKAWMDARSPTIGGSRGVGLESGRHMSQIAQADPLYHQSTASIAFTSSSLRFLAVFLPSHHLPGTPAARATIPKASMASWENRACRASHCPAGELAELKGTREEIVVSTAAGLRQSPDALLGLGPTKRCNLNPASVRFEGGLMTLKLQTVSRGPSKP